MEINSVYEGVCSRIKYYMRINGIPVSKYKFQQSLVDSYVIVVDYSYTFSADRKIWRIAGGQAKEKNYYSEAYHAELERLTFYAVNAQKEKKEFLDRKLSNPVQSFCENKEENVWVSDTISHQENCNTCHGKGKVTCSSCGGSGNHSCNNCNGSGKINFTEHYTDSDGRTQIRNITTICNNCGGYGKKSCSRCWGSGMVQCSSCSGYGYFTNYGYAYTKATTSTIYYADNNGLYRTEIVNLLCHSSNKFFVDHFCPSMDNHFWNEDGSYVMRFSGTAQVVEVYVILPKWRYKESGVNTINALLYPPLFDELLEDDLSPYLYENEDQRLSVILQKMSPFYSRRNKKTYLKLKDIPVINAAFSAYAKSGDAENTTKSNIVTNSVISYTGRLISTQMSRLIGDMTIRVMNSASPHTTYAVWAATIFVTIFIEVITAVPFFHLTMTHRFLQSNSKPEMMLMVFFSYILFFYIIVIGIFSPVFALFNHFVTRARQIGIDYEHKPMPSSRKPIIFLFHCVWIIGLLCFIPFVIREYNFNFRTLWDGYSSKFLLPLYSYDDTFLRFLNPFPGMTFHDIRTMILNEILSDGHKFNLTNAESYHYAYDAFVTISIIIMNFVYFFPTIVSLVRRRFSLMFFIGNFFLASFGFPWVILLYYAII